MAISDELNISVTVSREGMSALQLENPDAGFEIVSIGAGGRVWRREYVTGRYVHGRVLVNKVLETRTMPIVVLVKGANWLQARQRAQTMIDAFSQDEYLVTVTIDSAIDLHVCEPADIAPAGGDEWNKFEIMADQHQYVLSVPYDPVRTALS